MVVERIPGEKVYIDWIGDQPEILMDSITGELKKVHFFVTTVGVSNLVYAEAFEDEKLPNFIAEPFTHWNPTGHSLNILYPTT